MSIPAVSYSAIRRATKELTYHGFDVWELHEAGARRGRRARGAALGVEVTFNVGSRRLFQRWVALNDISVQINDHYQGDPGQAIRQVREILGREGLPLQLLRVPDRQHDLSAG